ncbi:MAG: hypothetical protein AAF570_04265 [Bacteroidota bacterium]
MRKIWLSSILLLSVASVFGQFSTDKIHIRFGYNLHNVHAKRFNTLIDEFNNSRYPHVTAENLGNVNWMHGFVGGVNYAFREDMELVAVLKSRRQYNEAPYADYDFIRSYLFRQHTLEVGVNMVLKDERMFSHHVGAGVMLGVLGVFTGWDESPGYEGSREMLNIDHTGVIGISLSYEARMKLHKHLRVFFRPVAQYALNSHVRKLTDFFDPQFVDGELSYAPGLDPKYENGSLSGLGIEGGLLFLLPTF